MWLFVHMQIPYTHKDKDWETCTNDWVTCIKIDGVPGIGPHVTSGPSDKMLYFPFQLPSICFQVRGRIWHKIRNLRALFYALICPCCVIASKSERWCKINTVNPRWHLQGFHQASEIGEFSVYFVQFSDSITYDCFLLRCGTFLKLLP